MNVAAVYLVHRFFYRLTDFFHHWYIHGSRRTLHLWVSQLERLDRTFAVRVTLRHFFEPLYQDYSIMGRILGVIFRTLRILLGFLIYAIVSTVFVIFYLIWLVIPLALIAYLFYYA